MGACSHGLSRPPADARSARTGSANVRAGLLFRPAAAGGYRRSSFCALPLRILALSASARGTFSIQRVPGGFDTKG